MPKKKRKKKDIIFLIGAGASKYIGVPTMKRFSKDLKKYLIERGKHELEKLSKQIMRKSDRPDDLENLLIEVGFAKRIDSTPGMRLVLESVKEYEKEQKPKTGKKGKRSSLSPSSVVSKKASNLRKSCTELEEDILVYIKQVCRAYDRDKAIEQYEHLLRTRKWTRLRMFTTNYDPILEWTCEALGLGYSDNFVEARRNRWLFDKTFKSFRKKRIDIIKLHGSVTWYNDENLGEIEKIRHQTDRSEEGHPIYNLMIMPARLKDIYSEPFFKLYKEFLDALRDSDLCVVIGHSLRDDYIRAAIEERLEDAKFRLIIISPTLLEERGEDELKRISSRKNVVYCPFKVERFCPQLSSILAKYLRNKKAALKELEAMCNREVKRIERGRQRLSASLNMTTVPKGQQIRIKGKFSGKRRRGYFEGRLVDANKQERVVVEEPTSFDKDEECGKLSGKTPIMKKWFIDVPQDLPPGKYSIVVGFYDNPRGGGKAKRQTVRERRINIEIQ